MKRLVIILAILITLPLKAMSLDFFVKASGGLILQPDIATQIDYEDYEFEDFDSRNGVEVKLGLEVWNLEFNYVRSRYAANGSDANSDTEVDIGFNNEALEVDVYLLDRSVKGGFNILGGLGLGVSELSYDFSECTSCENVSEYYRQTHLRVGLTYDLSESTMLSGNWVNHIFSDPNGFNGTNSFFVFDAAFRF